jgi:uncharacterized protein (TIGR02246 family)
MEQRKKWSKGEKTAMTKRIVALLGGLALLSSVALGQETPTVDQIHNELRALKDRAVEAINKDNKDALLAEFAPDATFTGMNNDVVHGRDAIRSYYDRMMKSADRLIDSISTVVEADELSRLYAGNQVAVASGKADTHFKVVGNKEFDWPLRWSATLMRTDGKWSVVNLHVSANALDNPLLSVAVSSTKWFAAGSGLASLVIGFIAAWFLRRPAAIRKG